MAEEKIKKKILFVCGEKDYHLFNRKSAIDSILCSILKELSAEYRISVNGEDFKKLEEESLLSTSEEPIHSLSKKKFFTRYVPESIKRLVRDKRLEKNQNELLVQIKNRLGEEKPDLILELLKFGSDIGAKLSEKYKVPFVVYYDSPLSVQYQEIFHAKAPKFIVNKEILSLKAAQHVVAYSQPVVNYIKGLIGTETNKYSVFQTLDYSRLSSINKEERTPLTIGFIGSFMPWHRVDFLVEAFNDIRKEGLNCKLLLVGAGETYESTQQMVLESSYVEDIEMTGFIDGFELQKQKNRIDIGVMPGSNWYGIPTKVFEYGAASIVSVAPDTLTINDIFTHEKELLLFQHENYSSLKENLQRLLINQELRETLRKNMSQRITEDFNLPQAKKIWKSVIDDNITN